MIGRRRVLPWGASRRRAGWRSGTSPPTCRSRGRVPQASGVDEGAFVAIEFVAGVAFLLLPVLLLVTALPRWSERQHAAVVAAREAVRVAIAQWPNDASRAANATAREVASNYGVPTSDLSVSLASDDARGGQVRATVTIVMPALVVPLMGRVGSFHWTTSYALRVDDYRSR
jgi:hypothetical protein